jgi:hypothetical protein
VSKSIKPSEITLTALFISLVNHLKIRLNPSSFASVGRIEFSDSVATTLTISEDGSRFYEKNSPTSVNNIEDKMVKNASNSSIYYEKSQSSSVSMYSMPLSRLKSYTNTSSNPFHRNQANNTFLEFNTKLSSYLEIDTIFSEYYKFMRFNLQIEPDEIMITVIKSVFFLDQLLTKSGKSSFITHISMQSYSYYYYYLNLVLSKSTASLIFEDLVILGHLPSKVSILFV